MITFKNYIKILLQGIKTYVDNKTFYPVGAIYISTNSTNPASLFGGTWTQIQDTFLLSAGSTYTAGSTGGSATHTLTSAEMPSHTHTQTAHTHSVGAHAHGLNSHTHTLASHVHSVGAHSHGLNSHTHSVGAHSHGLNSHVHSVGAHSHDLNNHTHSWSGTTSSADLTGRARFRDINTSDSNLVLNTTGIFSFSNATTWSGSHWAMNGSTASGYKYNDLSIDATHTHTVSGTTGAASGSTANSSAFNTGAASGSTANSTAFNTGEASGSTANSTAFNSGGSGELTTGGASGSTANSTAFNAGSTTATNESTGGGAAHNNMPPYLVVYMWKRTA